MRSHSLTPLNRRVGPPRPHYSGNASCAAVHPDVAVNSDVSLWKSFQNVEVHEADMATAAVKTENIPHSNQLTYARDHDRAERAAGEIMDMQPPSSGGLRNRGADGRSLRQSEESTHQGTEKTEIVSKGVGEKSPGNPILLKAMIFEQLKVPRYK